MQFLCCEFLKRRETIQIFTSAIVKTIVNSQLDLVRQIEVKMMSLYLGSRKLEPILRDVIVLALGANPTVKQSVFMVHSKF